MKKIFNKILFIVFLCFTVMPGIVPSEEGEQSVTEEQESQGDLLSRIRRWLPVWLGGKKQDVNEKLFKIIFHLSKDSPVDEDSAQRIFEGYRVQEFLPQLFSFTLTTKKGFMDSFIVYCEKQLKKVDNELIDFALAGKKQDHLLMLAAIKLLQDKTHDYCTVLGMATAYRGYLNKPVVSMRELAFAGIGVGVGAGAGPALGYFGGLSESMKTLAAYKASVYSVLARLKPE